MQLQKAKNEILVLLPWTKRDKNQKIKKNLNITFSKQIK